jgi:hypothetical protein
MQLHVARLCLDCQEVHADARCPMCASASFVPLSRWIPPQERRGPSRQQGDETTEAYRQLLAPEAEAVHSKWPKRAAVLLATVTVGGWLWRQMPRTPPDGGAGNGRRSRGTS